MECAIVKFDAWSDVELTGPVECDSCTKLCATQSYIHYRRADGGVGLWCSNEPSTRTLEHDVD